MEYIIIEDDTVDKAITLGVYYPIKRNEETENKDFFSDAVIKFKGKTVEYIYAFSKIALKVLIYNNIKVDEIISVIGSKDLETNLDTPLGIMGTYLKEGLNSKFNTTAFSQFCVRNSLKTTGSFNERCKVLKDTIKCNARFDGESVLIIDDISTTGATLKSYSNLLKQNGASKVFFLSIGKTYYEDNAGFWNVPEDYEFNIKQFNRLMNDFLESQSLNYQIYLTDFIFPNKYLISNKINEKIFMKFYELINSKNKLNQKEKFLFSETLPKISEIQYVVYKHLEDLKLKFINEITVTDCTNTFGASIFAIIDIFIAMKCFYGDMAFREINKLNFIIFDVDNSKRRYMTNLLKIYADDEFFSDYDLEHIINISYKSDFSIDYCDFVFSDENLLNINFNKQFIFFKLRKINDLLFANFNNTNYKISRVHYKGKAAILNLLSNSYINFININCISISMKNQTANLLSETNCNSQITNKSLEADEELCFLKRKNMEYFFYRLFGFSHFRNGQFEILEKIFNRKSVLGILPTGSGKSVCFQFPSLIFKGLTLVISPLRSLMLDQYTNFKNKGYDLVDYIDSSCDEFKKRAVIDGVLEGKIKVLYISPERLLDHKFKTDIEEALITFNINFLVIDEAHCLSQWGHDFRPSYLSLKNFCEEIGSPNIIALTATASNAVSKDIIDNLSLTNENIVRSNSVDRPEISYEVVKVSKNIEKLKTIYDYMNNKLPIILLKDSLKENHDFNSGLIFTIYARSNSEMLKGRSTEFVSKGLNELFTKNLLDLKTAFYHSRLEDSKRMYIQNQYIQNKIPALVATKGFGMGIDKPNINYVIHINAPASIEEYYQEGGRAGRNGEHAHSVIFYYSMEKQCVKLLNSMKIDKLPCVKKKTSNCYYGGFLCDIAAQVKLSIGISESSVNEHLREIEKFYYDLCGTKKLSSIRDNEIIIFEAKTNREFYERMLCELKSIKLIDKYEISEYKSNMQVSFYIFGLRPLDKKQMKNYVSKMHKMLIDYRNSKIEMLKAVREYIEEPKMCRRKYLLRYFNSNEMNDDECNFCDYEGIDLNHINKH